MKSMCNKYILIPAFFTLAISLLSYAEERSNSSTTNGVPAPLIGMWQITEVHTDTGATRTVMYNHDDFRLTGRLFTIERDRLITNTPEDKICTHPKFSTTSATPVDLIKHSMAGRGLPPETPTPKDYDLPLADNAPVEVLSINCKEGLLAGGLGRDDGITGAWMVVLNNDKLAVRWYDETILILKRLPVNAKPTASFDCEKAASSVEKTICGSIALAAFDQSIGQSYLSAVNQYKGQGSLNAINELRAQQKEWLAKRNKCDADIDCLQKTMEDRLQAIENGLIAQ